MGDQFGALTREMRTSGRQNERYQEEDWDILYKSSF
jgi:hypothetical protein